MSFDPVLSIIDLSVRFDAAKGRDVKAVEKVCLDFFPGRVVGVVGESGCGKSITARAVMGILPAGGRIVSGQALFRGENLFTMPASKRRALCGKHLAMVFQEPATALNPVLKVGDQVAEVLERHLNMSGKSARARAVELLASMGIAKAEEKAGAYPNQLSGGMRQRVAIAQALAADPQLLIADEPTTALDVTVQAQVLRLFARLSKKPSRAIWLITHDLGVVAELADEIVIMYAGRIAEKGPVGEIFDRAMHPYTLGLLASVQLLDRGEIKSSIPGQVPDLADLPAGCPFHPRCGRKMPVCETEMPPHFVSSPGHSAACWLHSPRL